MGKPWAEPNDAPAVDVLRVIQRMAQEYVYSCPNATQEMLAQVNIVWPIRPAHSSKAE
jgi:hypothetical protein